MIAYDITPDVPITAPVMRFSLNIPSVPVTIITKDVSDIEMKSASSIPIIIS